MNNYDFIIQTIMEAGELLIQKRDEGFSVMQKGSDVRDVVTSVDNDINEYLIAKIKKEFPEHSIHSEESSGLENESEYLWTIDPIDGTANFSRGIPHFSVCLGLVKDGMPVAGAVYNPVTNELFSFKKGEGAFLNDKQIQASDISELSKAHIFFHTGRKKELRDWGGESYKALLGNAKKTSNMSSSALDTCFVASGRIEASVYGTFSTMDISPVLGILKEAGGIIVDENGNEIGLSKTARKTFAVNNIQILTSLQNIL